MLAAHAKALPAGGKLAALAVLGTVLLLVQSPWLLGAAAAVASVVGILVVGTRRLAAVLSTGLVLAVAALALFTLALDGPRQAFAVLLRLCALILCAHLVTETTRASAIQDAIVAALRPVEFMPFVSAEKAGLAIAVALRSLPRLQAVLGELREARDARGLDIGIHRLVIPLIARILQDARETADAIDARSWTGAKEDR